MTGRSYELTLKQVSSGYCFRLVIRPSGRLGVTPPRSGSCSRSSSWLTYEHDPSPVIALSHKGTQIDPVG
jgi:hypothetical protein